MNLFTRTILSILIFACSAYAAQAQLTAGFTATPTNGCAPLVVAFSNTSTGASSYRWDLDNGDPSFTSADVSSSYYLPGTYTATLTAFNSAGDSSKHTVVITVYPLPTVSFTASDTAVCPGTPISFTSTSVGGVPGPMTFDWNFGDGSGTAGDPVTHTYYTPGYYNITLTATNAEGCNADTTYRAYIHVYTPPSPGFSAATTYFCGLPAVADFTSSVSGVSPYTYTWSFGDGSPVSHATDPTHNYTAYGDYSVTLIVTDGHTCSDTVTIPDYIFVGHVTGAFTYPDTVCLYAPVTFTNTSSTHTASNWTYGDGNTGTGDPGINAYSAPGLYTVTLVVYDGPCADTVTHQIYVRPGTIGTFTQNPLHPCPPPVGITFTGSVPAGSTVTWLFGDGGTGSGAVVTHEFEGRGVDTNRMIIHNGITGCTDTVINIDTLYDLFMNMTDFPQDGCAPLTVNFAAKIYTWEPPDTFLAKPYPWSATYTWNFGDGSATVTGFEDTIPSHTYMTAGDYWATVTAVTANGCTITDSLEVFVGAPPVVTFSATPTTVCFGHYITFNITVIDGPVSYFQWQFGDGGVDTTSTLSYIYNYGLPGVFTVTLTAYYNGCPSAPVIRTDYITIDSPSAIPATLILCSPINTVDFGDSSLGDNTHTWIFGDGTTSTAYNPVHTYSAASTFNGMLTTYNTLSGCRDTADFTIHLVRPVPGFRADTAICQYDSTTFEAYFTGGGATVFGWIFPGSIIGGAGGAPDTIRVGYNVSGIYPVTMISRDANDCLDTVVKSNYIHVGKPVPDFTASPTSGCWPLTVTFTDHSTDIAGSTPFTSYAWAFGDGGTSTVTRSTVTHTYTVSGVDTTTEIMTDNIGCKDTISLPLVTVYRPAANFLASTVNGCIAGPILFTNLSVGIVSSYWFFGDGDTSTLTSPYHTYADTGTFSVTLIVTDSHGCFDTTTYPAYIHITRPHASFYMNDSFSICPPLSVNFTNTSTNAVSYKWYLGDGGDSSVITSPSDYYISVGSYTVVLVATNIYGCTDTAIGHPTIYGYAGGFSYGPDTGCTPLVVHFTASISNVPNIVWDFSDGTTSSVSFSDTVSHVYTIPGAYVPRLILADNTGCKNSSIGIDTIKVDGVTTGFTTIPNPICEDGIVNFQDTSYGYWSQPDAWYWTFTNGDTSTLQDPSYNYTTTGTYPVTLKVTDGWGCTGTAVVNVNVYPPAAITVSPDTIICTGDKATLTGYGGVSYSWSPTSTLSCSPCNPTYASPTVVTTYTVTGTDTHGCINFDTVTVFLKDKTISIATGDTQICAGSVVQLSDSGATTYDWIPGTGLNNAHVADPLATPPYTIDYMVIAQLGSCVPDTNYVDVIVHPLPTVNAGPNQSLLAGSTAQLQATGSLINKYLWSDPATLNCDSCANPVASMSVSTTYFVTVTSEFGCKSSDSVSIHLFCDQNQLFIPNAFTPNNDGKDDIFYPRGKGVSIVKSFRIYNRWGELLFEREGINLNDESNGWDGTYKGDIPHPDVYVWVIEAVCETGEPMNLKGDVTIIR